MATTLRAALGEIQALKAELKQQAPKPAAPAPAKAEAAPTDVEAVKATFNKQLELRDALADAGITDAKQRKAVQKLFDAEGPTDVGTWVNETLDLLGLKRAAAAAAQAAKPTPATPTGASSNQGAPVAENRPEIAANPFQWSQEYAEKVGADEFFRSWKKYVASQGGAHPFAAFHERHQPGSGGSVDALAEKLAERLKTR